MRKALSLLFCIAFLFSSGQNSSAAHEALDNLADSIWNITYSNPELALQLCTILESEAKKLDYKEVLLLCYESKGEIFHVMANVDSSLHYYKIALGMTRVLEDQTNESRLLGLIGSSLGIHGQARESIETLQQSIAVAKQLNDSSLLCESYARLALIQAHFLNAEMAMKEGMHAMKCCKSSGNYRTIASIHSTLASVQLNLGNSPEAIRLNLAAIRINDSIGFQRNAMSARANLASAYFELNELEKAKAVNLETLLGADTVEAKIIRSSVRNNLALIYLLQDSLALAEYYVRESLQLAEKENLKSQAIQSLVTFGRIALKQGHYELAIDSLNRCLVELEGTNDIKHEIEALRYLGESQHALGNNEAAYLRTIERLDLADSLFRMQKSEEINRLHIQYETEKKDQAIGLLAQQNELAQTKNSWLKLGIVGLVLATSFIIFGIIQKRRKDKAVLEGKLALERSERIRLDEQLDFKKRELTEKALHLAQKNELLVGLKTELDLLRTSDVGSDVQAISNKIRFDQQIDNNWEQFTKAFTDTNAGFFDRLRAKHPKVSKSDLRLSALLSMHLNSKEVGTILNISDEGVRKARYRLRKKLELNKEDNLETYISSV